MRILTLFSFIASSLNDMVFSPWPDPHLGLAFPFGLTVMDLGIWSGQYWSSRFTFVVLPTPPPLPPPLLFAAGAAGFVSHWLFANDLGDGNYFAPSTNSFTAFALSESFLLNLNPLDNQSLQRVVALLRAACQQWSFLLADIIFHELYYILNLLGSLILYHRGPGSQGCLSPGCCSWNKICQIPEHNLECGWTLELSQGW